MNYLYSFIAGYINPIFKYLFYYQPTITNKKHNKNPIPKKIRTAVWKKYHKESMIGQCYACGKRINFTEGWHCSHVLSEVKGGKIEIDNLRTCCAHCNHSMGDLNLYIYIKNNKLKGSGSKNVNKYLKNNPSQINDVKTNHFLAKK